MTALSTAPDTRVVLVGLGRMGQHHLRVLRETPGFELAAVVDAHAEPPSDLGTVPFVRSIGEVSTPGAGIDFDAAVIATPTASHRDIALELIAMGKHLLIEKPIASTVADGREVVAAAHAKNVKLVVGHVERFNPAVRKLREIIREGWLGTVIHFAFTRVGGYPETELRGDNVILDLAVHDIDVLRSIVGAVKFEHSMCHVTRRRGVFDAAEIFLAAATGASATVHVNWITPTKIRGIRVTGTRGVCFVDYMLQTCELLGEEVEPTTDRIHFEVRKEEPLRAQAVQLHRFFTSGDVGDLCTGSDALAAVLLAERAVQVEQGYSLPRTARSTQALRASDEEWV